MHAYCAQALQIVNSGPRPDLVGSSRMRNTMHWNIVGGIVDRKSYRKTTLVMAEGWVSEEETSADKLSAAIQGGNKKEFIRLLKSETSDLQNVRDSVSNNRYIADTRSAIARCPVYMYYRGK